jgi:hypothetical protein
MIALLFLPLVAWGAAAQNPAEQTSGSAQSSTSISSDKSGMQTQSGAGVAARQTGSATANSGAASLSGGTIIQAELSKSLDAKKAKQGDQVSAKTTEDVRSNGKVVIPKGSKLIGHITEAKASTKEDSNSNLTIAWDKAVLKHGQEIPVQASIQAIGRPRSAAMGSVDEGGGVAEGPATSSGPAMRSQPGGSMGSRSGGSLPGAVGDTAGGVAGAAGSAAGGVAGTAGSATGLPAGGTLDATAHGVAGLQGISLNTQASATQGSELRSNHGNVRLESGTQLVLRVNP